MSLASRPVTRRLAIQLGYALRRVLENPSVGRRSVPVNQAASAIALSFAIVLCAGFYVGLRATVRCNELVISVETDRPLFGVMGGLSRESQRAGTSACGAAPTFQHKRSSGSVKRERGRRNGGA